jgi:hypothetical protein
VTLPRSVKQPTGYRVEATPEIALRFGPVLRRYVNEARRRDGETFTDADLDYVEGMMLMGAGLRAIRANPVSNPVATGAETLSSVTVESVTFSVSQLATKSGRSRQSIWERIDRGTLPAVKNARGHWRISAENAADLMGGTG